jgi:hypothetical protein
MSQIKLGDKVRDRVTGFEGIVTSRTVYLNGCIQYGVKPCKCVNGKPIDAEWIDEKQLILVKLGVVPVAQELTGGPQEHPRT